MKKKYTCQGVVFIEIYLLFPQCGSVQVNFHIFLTLVFKDDHGFFHFN
jgi:hypothetical protein